MSVVDDFLRRFAASPIHVPPLERGLAAYGGVSPDAFAAAVIESDREAAHPEAARIALELLATGLIEQASPPDVDIARLRTAILSVPAGAASVRTLLGEQLAAAVEDDEPARDPSPRP